MLEYIFTMSKEKYILEHLQIDLRPMYSEKHDQFNQIIVLVYGS